MLMKIRLSLTLAAASAILLSGVAQAATLNVYTSRNEQLIKPVFDLYSKKTGVEVKYLTDKDAALVQRLKSEGDKTQADVLMTVDAGNLWLAEQSNLFQTADSVALKTSIPKHLRSDKLNWFGFSVRARTIVYNTNKVKPADLTSYEALAGPAWKGRVCLRTSKKVYNQSLVAMMIAEHGEAKAKQIVEGWVSNLAAPVFSNDTKTIEAVAAGRCDVGIVNSYYFGRLKEKQPDLTAALFWPNQGSSGVHVNVSGAGITKHAPNRQQALKFLEWLATPEAQKLFAELNHEYPANPSVKPSNLVASWGEFKQSNMPLDKAGELQVQAVKLMDQSKYQ